MARANVPHKGWGTGMGASLFWVHCPHVLPLGIVQRPAGADLALAPQRPRVARQRNRRLAALMAFLPPCRIVVSHPIPELAADVGMVAFSARPPNRSRDPQ